MPNTPNNAADSVDDQHQHHQQHLPHLQYPPLHHPHLHPAAAHPLTTPHHLLHHHPPPHTPLGLLALRNGTAASLAPPAMGHTSHHLPSLSPNPNASPHSSQTTASPTSTSTPSSLLLSTPAAAATTTAAPTTHPTAAGLGGAGHLNCAATSVGVNHATAVAVSSVSAAPNPIGTGGAAAGRECAGCRKRITERYLLKALDLFWHEDCLKCGCCDCRLGEVGSTLYNRANLILCKRDYLRLFGTTGYCAACNKVIPAFEMVMRAKSNVYHLECFACQQCNHRFCVGDRFYLCDNKILCEYDYEERLVFANMAYNPSSLAHIRRQVSSLQPAGDSMNCAAGHIGSAAGGRHPPAASPGAAQHLHGGGHRPGLCLTDKLPALHHQQGPSNAAAGAVGVGLNGVGGGHLRGDDGSSGYGSPDSETFETPANQ